MSTKSPSQIRRTIQQAAANTTGEVLPRGDVRHHATQSQAERAAVNGISTRTQGKLDHLARQRPDLLQQVARGDLSVDRAYRQVRGDSKKKASPLERIQRIWAQASPRQRLAIARWIIEANKRENEVKT